ncbi:hypothetical protein SLS53_001116 [Cytospora paraplurivora]|uniref:Methyltransferase domain-containing protein n=1 Tax=Cytospora paraplurivora TaxID=2898453 RepID=A0AAN9UJS0_9PEZI
MAQPKVAAEYNSFASDYEAFIVNAPIGLLETELFFRALGDPAGLTILDLGGGTGLRARQVVERGAKSVDVVDFAAGMLHAGKKEAEMAGFGEVIRWYEADVSKPLSVNLETSYDIVLANWVLDHAGSEEDLHQMLTNATAYLKPGGRFVCVHTRDPRNPVYKTKKYGITLSNIEHMPGGLKYWVTLYGTDPPAEFSGTSLEVLYKETFELCEKFGLVDLQVVPFGDAQLVRNDAEFWKEWVEQPTMEFFTARKNDQ